MPVDDREEKSGFREATVMAPSTDEASSAAASEDDAVLSAWLQATQETTRLLDPKVRTYQLFYLYYSFRCMILCGHR